jgi:saccharopine dehydrogenase-like NADP-dependent oxidoreductase
VTSQSSHTEGQQHEDKNKAYLEKELIESWERIVDRNEVKNLDFYSPKEFAMAVDKDAWMTKMKQLANKIGLSKETKVEFGEKEAKLLIAKENLKLEEVIELRNYYQRDDVRNAFT